MSFCENRLIHCLDRYAQDFVRTDSAPDITCLHIMLSHMNTVCVTGKHGFDVIVNYKRNMTAVRNFFDFFAKYD